MQMANQKQGTLNQSKIILVSYGVSKIKHLSTVKIPCNFKSSKTIATFYITDTKGSAIMGLYTATKLDLLKFNLKMKQYPPESSQPEPCKQANNATPIRIKEDLIAQYPDFQGAYHITVDPSVPSVFQPPWKGPIGMNYEIKKQLDDMKNDVIAKTQEGGLTTWVSSIDWSQTRCKTQLLEHCPR